MHLAGGFRCGGLAAAANAAYRERMGRVILYAVGALVVALIVMMIVSIVMSALHFLFWVALVALLVIVGLRLSSGMRRRARR
jgi:peptidoglycan/LPS O-acetylase OafA/YrhL